MRATLLADRCIVSAVPTRPASSNGTPSGIFSRLVSGAAKYSANPAGRGHADDAARIQALHVTARSAIPAGVTGQKQMRNDPVADFYTADVRADALHDPGGLVPRHVRQAWDVREPVLEVQVRTADAAGKGSHEYVVAADLGDRHVADRKRLAKFAQDGGIHVVTASDVTPSLFSNFFTRAMPRREPSTGNGSCHKSSMTVPSN